jgi:hypothetical protein
MRIQLIAAAFLASAAPVALAADQPVYAGTWDCEVSTFTFTDNTYDSGEGPMPVEKVVKEGENDILTLDGDYQIGLSRVSDTSMQWLSMASGDMFECKRVE